ncbi:hypothetical protein OSB04_021429 [Centaurea solstitialis]|uniref:Uncharacterized protein n=1 Tax=Centaurea solstitialis TaxID=347529 RepID=A0AA38WHS0_9ASTR|nr:hypothetical protein OSB04_021429 [Centaurea solstitialis]
MANVDIEVGVGGGESETRPTNKTNKWWPWNTEEPKKSDVEILLVCKGKGEEFSRKPSPSIYLIRSSDQKVKPKFFDPQVVSIGPLHREEETLKKFEDQKTTHLHHLLGKMNDKPHIVLDKCLEKVKASIDRIRECYGETITYTDSDLAKMMVMDACFILDFLFLSKELRRLKSRNAILTHSIFRDLVLIENQIPFFVLQNIFDCTISTIQTISLTSGVLEHLQFLIPFKGVRYNCVSGTTHPHHILGLLQKCFYPPSCIEPTCPPLKVPNHCALDLDKAGVKFKPNKEDGNNPWPLNIDFNSSSSAFLSWCRGNNTLTIPELHIDDYTELFLRNVIAYEQCTPDVPDYITSYVCAIDMLIDTKEDLSKLVESKVLTNHLGSNKDATKMLNRISKQFVFEEFYYTEEWKKLNDYYKGYVPRNMALLKSTYFSSPWTIIALFAGVVVFTFSIVQAILRIIKY